jgi:hypothetical protein
MAKYLKSVLLRRKQLTYVQRIYQLYFLIHYCWYNTRKVRAPRERHTCTVLASFKVKNFVRKHLFRVEPRSIEHV